MRPKSDNRSSEITEAREGQIMTAVGDEKHCVANASDLPKSQAYVQMLPATPSGLHSNPKSDDHNNGTAGNGHD